ncbi:HEAT repeat domain-containing protein [Variovorax sp. ZT5P49]|uniref:HEAT repeat domain-containing protein n=1 Tax=Variovorax sp. ZT5P49 TaxID=3443733 RepID=UPI003F47F42A
MPAPELSSQPMSRRRRRSPSFKATRYHARSVRRPHAEMEGCLMMVSLRQSDEAADLIEALAVPYRATAAYRALLQLGARALPAVRAGLRHGNADVRFHCCRFLDRYLQPDTLADLLGMLDDSDERVRMTTLHTLACDRCKEGSCRPEEAEVLPRAMGLLTEDPSAHVRAMAIEVVGQFVHSNRQAVSAIEAVVQSDPSSAVRKKAGWYAPGGAIYRRSALRQPGSASLRAPKN